MPQASRCASRRFILPDYVRPSDFGMTVEQFRAAFWWATEYGPQDDPYWSRAEIEEAP